MLTRHFDYLRTTRSNIISMTKSLSLDQVNHIPPGFNNNIIWNLGHILVTQYLLCYRLSGLPCPIDDYYIGKYRRGSRPEAPVDAKEVAYIRTQLMLSPNQMESDYNEGRFADFQVYLTGYKVELQNAEDAIQFNNIHEGLHLGYVMAMKKHI